MSRELSRIDSAFMSQVAAFFFVEYAKRHAMKFSASEYFDLQAHFKRIKRIFYDNCKFDSYTKDCFSVFLKTMRSALPDIDMSQFECPIDFIGNGNLSDGTLISCQNIRMCSSDCKSNLAYDAGVVSLFSEYVEKSTQFVERYNCSDEDFFELFLVDELILRWERYSKPESEYKRIKNAKYSPIYELKNCKDNSVGILIDDALPDYERPDANVRWIYKNSKFSLPRLSFSSEESTSYPIIFSKVLGAVVEKVENDKSMALLNRRRGDSIRKRLVGLWMWDKFFLNKNGLEEASHEISVFFDDNGLEKYSDHAAIKAYAQTKKFINGWLETYGDMNQSASVNNCVDHRTELSEIEGEDCARAVLKFLFKSIMGSK